MSDLKVAVSASSLGMYGSFWNPFSVEMCEFINEVEILEEERAIGAS